MSKTLLRHTLIKKDYLHLLVICTDCTVIQKYIYHTIAVMSVPPKYQTFPIMSLNIRNVILMFINHMTCVVFGIPLVFLLHLTNHFLIRYRKAWSSYTCPRVIYHTVSFDDLSTFTAIIIAIKYENKLLCSNSTEEWQNHFLWSPLDRYRSFDKSTCIFWFTEGSWPNLIMIWCFCY